MASKENSWKIFGITVGFRVLATLITFLAVTYMAAANWQWYTSNLGNTIKQPKWADPTSNWIIWVGYFLMTMFIWNRHQAKHPDMPKMDLLYPINLILTFITFTLFFEQRQISAAKWFGAVNIVLLAYMIFSEFVNEPILSTMLVINFAILLYTECQLWYFSRHENYLVKSGLSPNNRQNILTSMAF